MRSLAVAPATKYTQWASRAIGSRLRRTRTIDGSTGLLGSTERWSDSLLIDHPRGFGVAAIMCRQKVGISKYWGNDVREIFIGSEAPECIENFDVAGHVGAHPSRRDQSRNRFAGVDCELCRFEIPRQLLRGGFASPVRVLLRKIGLVKAFRVGLEAPRIELRAKRDWIVGHPFFNQALRIEQFSFEPLLEAYVPSRFEILQNRTDRSECYSRLRRDLTVGGLKERRPTCERKSDLEASGLQRAKISFATFCGPRLAHDVDEQARPFEVGVAGSVDEWQMELATALGYFSGDE